MHACMQNSRRLAELEAKQDSIKESVDKILQLLSSNQHPNTANAPPEDLVNSIDVIHMPTRDVYYFGLELLDMLFTPEELGQCLVYKSKRSWCNKDGLHKNRVSLLIIMFLLLHSIATCMYSGR